MQEIWNRFVELLKQILAIVLDLLFLYLWAIVISFAHEWVAPRVVGLAGIDTVVFGVLQGIFAVSTVYPVVIALYRDFAIMLKRAQAEVAKA